LSGELPVELEAFWSARGDLAALGVLPDGGVDPEGGWLYCLELADTILRRWSFCLERCGDNQATAGQLAELREAGGCS